MNQAQGRVGRRFSRRTHPARYRWARRTVEVCVEKETLGDRLSVIPRRFGGGLACGFHRARPTAATASPSTCGHGRAASAAAASSSSAPRGDHGAAACSASRGSDGRDGSRFSAAQHGDRSGARPARRGRQRRPPRRSHEPLFHRHSTSLIGFGNYGVGHAAPNAV